MKTNGLSIVLLVLYGIMHVQVVLSCSCPWMRPEQVYCMTHYAIQVTVLTETITFPRETDVPDVPEDAITTTESFVDRMNKYVEYTYDIEIQHVYRGTANYETAFKRVVSAGLNYCTHRLEVGHTYFLMGYTYGSSLSPACNGMIDLAYDGNRRLVESLTESLPQCDENQVRNRKSVAQATSFLKRAVVKNN